MKKICHLTSVHPVFDTRIFHKEIKTLARAGYDVTLIAQHNKNEIIDGIKIVALPKPKNRFERFIKLDYLLYKKALQQKTDIYHFHDPELIPWVLKLKKKTGAKIIYDVHEDIAKQILSKDWILKILRKIISYLFNFFEKKIARKFDFLIVASKHILYNFKKEKINNIELIANYPIIKYFVKNEAISNKKNITSIIYIGDIIEIKGIKIIIESLAFIKTPIKLILIGKFYNKQFEKQIKNLSLWKNNVEYLGEIPINQAAKKLEIADIGIVCIYPIKRHMKLFPVKLFEYMAARLPIVASNFPLWEEIIEKNNCGISVNPLKSKEIAMAIEYLIEHPEKAKKMGENGRNAVLEKYNWENESKKLLEIYKNLLK